MQYEPKCLKSEIQNEDNLVTQCGMSLSYFFKIKTFSSSSTLRHAKLSLFLYSADRSRIRQDDRF